MSENQADDESTEVEETDAEETEVEETEETEERTEVEVSPDELDDAMLGKLMEHPEVKRYVKYNETSIPQFIPMLRNLQTEGENADVYDLFVQGVAERSGRISERTVRKVLENVVAEYESVSE